MASSDKQYRHELNRDVLKLKKTVMVLDEWPELRNYPDLVEHGSGKNDALLRYCILLTDRGSGLLLIPNIELRHEKAWVAAGLPANDERKEKAFNFTDEAVAAMSYALLEEGDSMMLAYVLAGEATLWKEIKRLRTSDEIDGDLFDELPGRIRALEAEKKLLFSGDKALEDAAKVTAKSNQGLAEQLSRETIKRD
jgi:hypothetical protein